MERGGRALFDGAVDRDQRRGLRHRAINVDPRTGEILNADILVSATWVQRWRGQSGRYVAPVAAVRAVLQEDRWPPAQGRTRGSAGSAKD